MTPLNQFSAAKAYVLMIRMVPKDHLFCYKIFAQTLWASKSFENSR